MLPPKMGEGVLESRVGSTQAFFSAALVSARTTTRTALEGRETATADWRLA